jgi:hypothetical protein
MTERHKLRKRQSQAEIAKRQSDYGRTDRGIKSGLISHAKSRALDHDETFNMTIDTISELPTHCPNPFCRVKLEVAVVRGGSDNSYSLDKIDRTKPYDGFMTNTNTKVTMLCLFSGDKVTAPYLK